VSVRVTGGDEGRRPVVWGQSRGALPALLLLPWHCENADWCVDL